MIPVIRQPRRLLFHGLTATVVIVLVWAATARIEVSVRAPGIVRPEGDVKRVQVEIAGRVGIRRMTEGQQVRSGDVILEMDSTDLGIQRRTLERRIDEAESASVLMDRKRARLLASLDVEKRRLQSEMAVATFEASVSEQSEHERERRLAAELAVARIDTRHSAAALERYRTMHREGLAPATAVDEMTSSWERAVAGELRAAAERRRPVAEANRLRLESLVRAQDAARTRGAYEVAELDLQRERLRADLVRAYADLEHVDRRISALTIAAPIDGIVAVITRDARESQFLNAGAHIATIAPVSSAVTIESWMPAGQATSIKPGQTVTISTRDPGNRPSHRPGRVSAVAPDAIRMEDGTPVVRVLIHSRHREGLPVGTACEVAIRIRRDRILQFWINTLRKEFR